MDETDMTGEISLMMMVDRTIKRAPIAWINADTLYYAEVVEALCRLDPLFDLIIGNVPGMRKPDDPNPKCVRQLQWLPGSKTGEQRFEATNVQDVACKMAILRKDLMRWQEDHPSLRKFQDMKEEVNRGKYLVTYKKLKGILYCIHQQKNTPKETNKQILVPKLLRTKVMKVAHNSIFGGYLGIKKT